MHDPLCLQSKCIMYIIIISCLYCFRCLSTQKQLGSANCGLFALAFAFLAASGQCPEEYNFDQSRLRQHFLTCLEEERMDSFPIMGRRQARSRRIKLHNITVCCSCRMPHLEPMIKCRQCHEDFHINSCVRVPAAERDQWLCPVCKQ